MPIYKKINKIFFKSWTNEMSYILGFMYADGNILKSKRGTYFFSICSSDKVLLEQMLSVLESNHKLSENRKNGSLWYRFQIGSKEMCLDLIKLGLTPNKSRRMRLPNVPKKFLPDFIRGYFDGDGNVWTGEIHKDRKRSTYVITTVFTSASIEFLKSLKDHLHQCGLERGSISVSRIGNYSRLIFSVRDTLKIYKIMYNRICKLYLKRKKLIFEDFLKLRV